MKKKILVCTWTPFSKWDYIRYGLDKLNKNYVIKIYDISNIIFNQFNSSKLYQKVDKIEQIQFKDLKKFISLIKKIEVDLIINTTGLDEKHPIYLALLEKKVKILTFLDFKLNEYFFFPKKFYFYIKYFFKLFINLYKNNNNNNDIVIIAGNNLQNKLKAIGKKKIFSHSINYDLIFRKKIKFEKKIKKNVCYIDSGFGFHPDFKLSKGINKKFNINLFSKNLNFFFKQLKNFGYKVYFLANPKIPKRKQKIYKNCKIIYYNTLEYIKKSDLVIYTSSSTIEYAILFNKKIVKIYSNAIKSYPINFNENIGYKKFFFKDCLNIDFEITKKMLLEKSIIPSKQYLKYISCFVKHPKSKNISHSDLIENIIKNKNAN